MKIDIRQYRMVVKKGFSKFEVQKEKRDILSWQLLKQILVPKHSSF